MAKAELIIEALGRHKDPDSISVLEEVGTNCPIEDIREETVKALVRKNSHDSLRVVIINKGKGVNDLSPKVAMSAVNELLALNDKSELLNILDDTIKMHSDDEVKNTARSVKALINLSN